MSVSKEMLELAEEIDINRRIGAIHRFSDADATIIQAALRAYAVAEPVAWQHRTYVAGVWLPWHQLDEPVEHFRVRYAFNFANGSMEVRPIYAHPAPAAPVPASVREARLSSLAEGPWSSARRALASLPAPEAAPTDNENRAFYEQASREYLVEQALRLSAALEESRQEVAQLMKEAAPTREEIISIVEDECFLNHFSPVEKTKSQKTLWRVGHNIRERILALKAAPAK